MACYGHVSVLCTSGQYILFQVSNSRDLITWINVLYHLYLFVTASTVALNSCTWRSGTTGPKNVN